MVHVLSYQLTSHLQGPVMRSSEFLNSTSFFNTIRGQIPVSVVLSVSGPPLMTSIRTKPILFLASGTAAGFLLHAALPSRTATPQASGTAGARPTGDYTSHPERTKSTERMPRAGKASFPSELERDFSMQIKGCEAAKAGMESFVSGLATIEEEKDRDAWIRGAFAHLAKLELDEALSHVSCLRGPEEREAACLTLLIKWSNRSTADLLADGKLWTAPLQDPADGLLPENRIALMLGRWMLRTGFAPPERVGNFACEFLTPHSKVGLVTEAAVALAKTDPAAALDLAGSLPGDEKTIATSALLRGWTAEDPASAWRWAENNPGDPRRNQLRNFFLEDLGKRDAAAISRLIGSLGMDGDFRKLAYQQLGRNWSSREPREALEWAKSLTDPRDRADALNGLKANITTGIGFALMGKEGDGMMVGAIVEGSPASQSGLLAGDAILAVSGPDGSWLQTAAMNQDEFLGHSRGDAGTRVSIQVRGKDGKTRVITVNRDYLLPSGKEP